MVGGLVDILRGITRAMQQVSFAHLTGRSDSHLVACEGHEAPVAHRLAPGAASAFAELTAAAAGAGIALQIASGYRDFTRQLAIWNAKAAGDRKVLSDSGIPLDVSLLSERERVFAILRWSALPGASRHHWGTDIDVYDAAAVSGEYKVQLSLAECRSGGVFYALHCWLDERIGADDASGFVRPYARDGDGVAPEPWHLSYAPEARLFEQRQNRQRYREFIASQPIALKQTILANFDDIYARFIQPTGT